MKANVLKKVKSANPLVNLHMWNELEEHDKCTTDEELAAFYHKMLDKAEQMNNSLLEGFIFAMITFSTGQSFNPEMLIK